MFKSSLDILPDDVFNEILQYLEFSSIVHNLTLVNHRMYDIVYAQLHIIKVDQLLKIWIDLEWGC